MSRISAPFTAARTAAVIVMFRLGLSWLVGRRWLLLTTSSGESEAVRRTALRYRWRSGDLVIDNQPGADWAGDLATRPVAMAQAAPGPLSVIAEFEDDGSITLPPTGRPSPPPVLPDLLWVYPVVLLALRLRRKLRRGVQLALRRS